MKNIKAADGQAEWRPIIRRVRDTHAIVYRDLYNK